MDIQTLLKSLLDHKVKFLVIGAWALPAHGYSRMTQDVDIFIEATEENATRTMEALKVIGYDVVNDVDVRTFLTKKVLLREYILRADIHPFVKGMTFDKAWANKIETQIKGVKVFVPSLDDVIKMKEGAGRYQDLADLEILREIKRQKSQM